MRECACACECVCVVLRVHGGPPPLLLLLLLPMRWLALAAVAGALACVWPEHVGLDPPPIFRDVFYLFLFTCWPTPQNKTSLLKVSLLHFELSSSPKGATELFWPGTGAEWCLIPSQWCVPGLCVLFWPLSASWWAVIERVERVSNTNDRTSLPTWSFFIPLCASGETMQSHTLDFNVLWWSLSSVYQMSVCHRRHDQHTHLLLSTHFTTHVTVMVALIKCFDFIRFILIEIHTHLLPE